MRVYISGPITGRAKEDYMRHFTKAAGVIEAAGYKIYNPALSHVLMPEDFTHEDYMAVSMAALKRCEAVFMLKGWEDSDGARQEHMLAKILKLPVLYEEELTKDKKGA